MKRGSVVNFVPLNNKKRFPLLKSTTKIYNKIKKLNLQIIICK